MKCGAGAGVDEKALGNLEEKLWSELKAQRDNLTLAGLYAFAVEIINRGELERRKEIEGV